MKKEEFNDESTPTRSVRDDGQVQRSEGGETGKFPLEDFNAYNQF